MFTLSLENKNLQFLNYSRHVQHNHNIKKIKSVCVTLNKISYLWPCLKQEDISISHSAPSFRDFRFFWKTRLRLSVYIGSREFAIKSFQDRNMNSMKLITILSIVSRGSVFFHPVLISLQVVI